jgi:hypothetical protein
MAAGQGGGLREICGHVLDRALGFRAPTVLTSDVRALWFASRKSILLGFFWFVRHLVSGSIHTHQYFVFLGHLFLVQFEHHEMIVSESRSIDHVTRLPDYIERLLLFTGGCSLPNTGSLMILTSLLCALALALLSYGKPAVLETRNSSDLLCTCNDIAAAISAASQVFFPRMSFSHLWKFI